VRRLAAYWYQGKIKQRIGTLLEAPRGLVVFEWDRDFLLTPIELSPLNFAKSPEVVEFKRDLFEGLPGLFADSVPDGWGKILLKRGLDKSGVTTSALSPLDALAYIGDSGMGALSFAPEMREPNEWADGKVSLSELEKGIKPILGKAGKTYP
jgi:serine/threonine-protein kinase HipA